MIVCMSMSYVQSILMLVAKGRRSKVRDLPGMTTMDETTESD